MTETDFDKVTDLASVRAINAELMALDPRVGPYITEADHATVRRIVRQWENKLLASVAVRKARSRGE